MNNNWVQSIDVTISDVAPKSKVLIDGKLLPCSTIRLLLDDMNDPLVLEVRIPLLIIPNRTIEYDQELR